MPGSWHEDDVCLVHGMRMMCAWFLDLFAFGCIQVCPICSFRLLITTHLKLSPNNQLNKL